ncbi:hypothetical protein BDV98DRAFT_54067 [Pterulicium gracile]|uniref:Uncharacterized protein n=1 Tax=Pterulicium gracile TaxID=1884261 RepID=A0A5C3QJU0_9AGAR|nr:hypothetical protein BDV98DRAFT_54067 [Pterula gracilis]
MARITHDIHHHRVMAYLPVTSLHRRRQHLSRGHRPTRSDAQEELDVCRTGDHRATPYPALASYQRRRISRVQEHRVNGSPKFRTVVQAWDLDTYRCVAMARFAGLSGFAWNQEEEHENLVVLGKPNGAGTAILWLQQRLAARPALEDFGFDVLEFSLEECRGKMDKVHGLCGSRVVASYDHSAHETRHAVVNLGDEGMRRLESDCYSSPKDASPPSSTRTSWYYSNLLTSRSTTYLPSTTSDPFHPSAH